MKIINLKLFRIYYGTQQKDNSYIFGVTFRSKEALEEEYNKPLSKEEVMVSSVECYDGRNPLADYGHLLQENAKGTGPYKYKVTTNYLENGEPSTHISRIYTE
jgi:hypothetical protein